MKKFFFSLCMFLGITGLWAQEGGADENTPSRSEYFSWINNANEGATEAQTAANLRFFEWLHREYGMVLDLYAFDAGAVDGCKRYGSTSSPIFHSHFPGSQT